MALARIHTASWLRSWSSGGHCGETVKVSFPLISPLSQSVYNSITARFYGAVANDLQMPGIKTNRGEAMTHRSPQIPPTESLLLACWLFSSVKPLDLLLALHSHVLYCTAKYCKSALVYSGFTRTGTLCRFSRLRFRFPCFALILGRNSEEAHENILHN